VNILSRAITLIDLIVYYVLPSLQARIIKLLLSASVDLNGHSKYGIPVLLEVYRKSPYYSMEYPDIFYRGNIIALLLNAGVNVAITNGYSKTALHCAA